MKFHLTFVLLLLLGGRAAFADDTFAQANQQYASGDFAAARDGYENLIHGGETNAALFYNLGNACFRLSDFGHAVLNYQRALALEPHHPEAAANLRLVRDKARALELQQSRLDRLTNQLTSNQFTILAAVSFWLLAFATGHRLFSKGRSSALNAAIVFLIVALAASAFGLYAREIGARGNAFAIVTAPQTDARLAVADNSGTVLTLPPGSEIKFLSERGDWIYAELPNNLRGWIPAQNAERVRL